MKGNNNLSYIEIIIIAVVLGLIVRTFLPQYAEAVDEKNISKLIEALEEVRAGIDVYHTQHGYCFPPCDSFESFESALTGRVGPYGPYVEAIPANPFNSLRTVRFDGESAGCGEAGWRFDSQTGLFQADHDPLYAGL